MKVRSLNLYPFFIIFFLLQCTLLPQKSYHHFDQIPLGPQESFSLIFSHNIHGELEPCGCPRAPRGGLPQLAGKFHQLKQQKKKILYVDTGDALFDSETIPPILQEESKFSAKTLALGLEKLQLKYFVPGEKDFAAGLPFLEDLSKKRKFTFLVSNLRSNKTKIKFVRWAQIKVNESFKIYLIGLTDPKNFTNKKYKKLFHSPDESLKKILHKIKQQHPKDQSPPFFILLSHLGYKKDLEVAKKFPDIKWIIGSHDQKFFIHPIKENETFIVQGHSQNHYLGEIHFQFSNKKTVPTISYTLHPIPKSLEKILQPNPFHSLITDHRNQKKLIQEKIQRQQLSRSVATVSSTEKKSLKTYLDCMSCHEEQTTFWQKTSHALGYISLVQKKAQYNQSCLPCHTLGFQSPQGPQTPQEMTTFEDSSRKRQQSLNKYLEAFQNFTHTIKKDIRSMTAQQRLQLSHQWIQLDQALQVKNQYANIQCLHCHEVGNDHPFTFTGSTSYKTAQNTSERTERLTAKCLQCHSPSRSPHLYSRKLPQDSPVLDKKKFQSYLKQVSCPQMQ